MQIIYDLVLPVLASLGGGALIIGGFAHWLGNLWATRLIQNEKNKLDLDIESYKVKLKKSEFLFQKEFEAASEFIAMMGGFTPTHYRPDMDWHDVCDEIAQRFSVIEPRLKDYLSKHGAILKKEAKEALSLCIGIAGENKFNINGPDVPDAINAHAENLYNKLKEVEKSLLNQVHTQSST